MNKEITPLEALNILVGMAVVQQRAYEIKPIIENALKQYQERIEELEETNHLMFIRERKNTDKLKALEIIKETPIFAWYITIYKDAYEMISDVKGFRPNSSVEELQEMFNLLKEVLL